MPRGFSALSDVVVVVPGENDGIACHAPDCVFDDIIKAGSRSQWRSLS